jgi:hypothetical protein
LTVDLAELRAQITYKRLTGGQFYRRELRHQCSRVGRASNAQGRRLTSQHNRRKPARTASQNKGTDNVELVVASPVSGWIVGLHWGWHIRGY